MTIDHIDPAAVRLGRRVSLELTGHPGQQAGEIRMLVGRPALDEALQRRPAISFSAT